MSEIAPVHRSKAILLGCDYNPEQWSPEIWDEDIRLMSDAGVGLVAINIFGWSHIQKATGEFEFSTLDAVIERLHAAGIRINLGTGTSSPPPWLTTLHPEILPHASDGTRRWPGGRQAWCASSPIYRAGALRVVEAVAERYGSHPALAIWHVSNELGCHNAHCYCEVSTGAFRQWLIRRYETIPRLNDAWGTAFWSQIYSSWDEILPPRAALTTLNPAQVMDFQRFSSDELLDYFEAEKEVIRRHSDAPVTTNFMATAHIRELDYWRWNGAVDVVANDHYLDHRLENPTLELSFAADLTRGLAEGKPWMLMEHSTGAVNWQPINYAKQPGQMMRNTLMHVARGADAACFFQWRASVRGAEKFHSAMVPHAGTESQTWREVLALGETLNQLSEVADSTVHAEAALVFSWESWWSVDSDSTPTQALSYLDVVHSAYAAAHSLNITVDIVPPGADLSQYRLVLVPALHMLSESAAQTISDWVHQGGTAVVTFDSGIVDEEDRVWTGGYGGPLREMLGVFVEEFAPVGPEDSVRLASGRQAVLWTERIRTTTAETQDRYSDGPSAGRSAVTRNSWGRGVGWYVSCLLDGASFRELIAEAAESAAVAPVIATPSGIEATRRMTSSESYLFVTNHSEESAVIPASGFDLTTQSWVNDFSLDPGCTRVIREQRSPAEADAVSRS